MGNKYIDFYLGAVNYYGSEELSISRERLSDKVDLYEIKAGDVVLFRFPGKLGKKIKKSGAEIDLETGEITEPPAEEAAEGIAEEKPTQDNGPPKKKSMGGKTPYVKTMTTSIDKLLEQGKIDIPQAGCLTLLTPCIEWGTGKLINRRSKRRMTGADISKRLHISEKTWQRHADKLSKNSLLTVTKDGYYISSALYRKGGTEKKGDDRDVR